MRFILFLIIVISSVQAKRSYRFENVKYIKNYDGDTITFNILDVHPLLGNKISIRVNGIDTPEIKGKTQCEKDKAKEGKKLVENMMKKADKLVLENSQRGKYFRIVSDVYADGKSVAQALLDAKLAVPYDGGTKSEVDWCKYGR